MEQGSSSQPIQPSSQPGSSTVRGRGICRGRGISRWRGVSEGIATAYPNSQQIMARGNGERGRGISRGRGNVAQTSVYPNSQESIGQGRGLPYSKLNAIRGRGISGGRGLPSSRQIVGLPSSRPTARGRGQEGPDLDNISHDNNMASK
ncbi:hypothetical protein ACE6H2_014538 [Prunus campanulata]